VRYLTIVFCFLGVEGEDQMNFQSALIRSLLRTFDKLKDLESLPDNRIPSQETLKILVHLACGLEKNQKLAATIVLTLGNLVMAPVFCKIPDSEKLAYKLSLADTVDSEGLVTIIGSLPEISGDTEAGGTISTETYISSIVANIILQSKDAEFPDDMIEILMKVVSKHEDKTTRILCSEILFQASADQVFPESKIHELRYLTMDSVPDIQVHVSGAYCRTLELWTKLEPGEISLEDLAWLPKLYAVDQMILLGEKNFATDINEPILRILILVAPFVDFTEEIFQMLTLSLKEEIHIKVILELLQKNQGEKFRKFPAYIFEIVEDIFVSKENYLEVAGSLIVTVSLNQGTRLSPQTLDHFHQFLQFERSLSTRRTLGYCGLLSAQLNQDLPEFMFQDLDMEIMLRQLIQILDISLPEPKQDAEEYDEVEETGENYAKSVQNLLLSTIKTKLSGIDVVAKALESPLGEMAMDLVGATMGTKKFSMKSVRKSLVKAFAGTNVKKKITKAFSTGKEKDDTIGVDQISNVLKSVLSYQNQGRKLSLLCFVVMKQILQQGLSNSSKGEVIESMIQAAENAQSILPDLMKEIFQLWTVSNEPSETNLKILSFALALVHNNQSLPSSFIEILVAGFSAQTATGRDIGESEEYDQTLFIVSKLARNPNIRIAKAENVAQHLSNVYMNSSKNAGTKMGVLNMFSQMQKDISSEERAKQVLLQMFKFWKRSRKIKHRLEILSGLIGLVSNLSYTKIDRKKVFEIFKTALQSPYVQIMSKGLDGFLACSLTGTCPMSYADYELLISLLCKPNIGEGVKSRIWKFLGSTDYNTKTIPKNLAADLELLKVIETGNDVQFLKSMKFIMESKEISKLQETIPHSLAAISRLESIILGASHHRMVLDALQLIQNSQESVFLKFPTTTFQAVSSSMSVNPQRTEFQTVGWTIFGRLVTLHGFAARLTESTIRHLAMCQNEENISLFLQILEQLNTEISSSLHAKLRLQLALTLKNNESIEAASASNMEGIDEKSTVQLIDFLEANPQSGNYNGLFDLLVRSVLKGELRWNAVKLTKLLESKIQDSEFPSCDELKLYQKVILNGNPTHLTEIMQKISSQYFNFAESVRIEAIQCVLDSLKRPSEGAFLPHHLIEILTSELSGDIPRVRFLSMEVLTKLKPSHLGTLKLEVPNFSSMTQRIFELIFDGEDGHNPVEEMNKDPDFAIRLLKLLYSLKYWDFALLKSVKEDRSKWAEYLITSDFLAKFAVSESVKIKITVELRKLFQMNNNAEKLLSKLGEAPASQHPLEDDVLEIVSCLPKLSFQEAYTVLEKATGKSFRAISDSLNAVIVSKLLNSKMEFHCCPEIIQLYALKLIASASPRLSSHLIESIKDVKQISELDKLLELLGKVRNPTFLFDIHPNMGLQDLIILLDAHYLLRMLPDGVTHNRETRFLNHFSNLLKSEIETTNIQTLIDLGLRRRSDNSMILFQILDHVLTQSSQYQLSQTQFENVLRGLQHSDRVWNLDDCVDTVKKIILEFKVDSIESGVKSLGSILTEYQKLNNEEPLPDGSAIFIQIQEGRNLSKFSSSTKEIFKWDDSEIRSWAAKARKAPLSADKPEDIFEALVVAKRAFYITTNYNLTNVQILTCLKTLTGRRKEGILCQVATGSGKSAIIGIISTISCLTGYKVDIYTSSSVLAERDSKEWSKFYSLFGLSSDHNGDKSSSYISGKKTCYERDIVYGDCSQFQFDFLRDAYSDLGTRAGRDFKSTVAIIDEVDAMLIDDSAKLARLSSTVPGTDLLQLLYFLIWDRLTFIKTHLYQIFGKTYFLEGKLDSRGLPVSYVYAHGEGEDAHLRKVPDIAAFVIHSTQCELKERRIYEVQDLESWVEEHLVKYATALISSKKVEGFKMAQKIQIPTHLQYFAESQIPNWVNSALTALTFQENVHYVVHDQRIKPVDFSTTGIIHNSTNWNNGLHQFLQLKHRIKMDTESVTTNFLSNIAIVTKYQSRVVGFTGTLGSSAGQSCLKNVYKVELAIFPETHFKRFVRFPDCVASTEETWLEEILRTTLQETAKRRGVLIICETIEKAELIGGILTKLKRVHVKLYTTNHENQEKRIEQIHPGDVIVATNLAGRGTDIKTTDIEPHGGLHVCLTFLPSSLRIEEQAFGRTSRQGKKGSGQLIVLGGNLSVESRDKEEEASLQSFQVEKLPLMTLKDSLFTKFLDFFQSTRNEIRELKKSYYEAAKQWTFGCRPAPTQEEILCLQALEEEWSMFLKKLDDGFIKGSEANTKFDEFLKDLRSIWNSKGDVDEKITEIMAHSQNCFSFIQLGNFEFNQNGKAKFTLPKAISYYEKAINIHMDFAAGAWVGKGLSLLYGEKNILLPDSHEEDYKEAAVLNLTEGRKLLHEEMAYLTVMQNMLQRQDSSSLYTSLGQQLTQKANILGSYLKTVEGAIAVTEKSLRRVYAFEEMEDRLEMHRVTDLSDRKIK